MREGICVAGNLIVDILYRIESYPRKSELTTIVDGVTRSTGGAACNVSMDLARLDPHLPLSVIGVMGDDAEADFIEQQLEQYENIDIQSIRRNGVTSFTVVMNENHTNTRTFFQYRGANANLSEEHFDFKAIRSKFLHVGYILLLDTLDEPDKQYGTKMARLLAHAQKEGIRTSVDVVSEMGGRFKALVPPALKYTDYCVINELEAQQATGVLLRGEDGIFLYNNVKKALSEMISLGVSTWAAIHAPEGGFGMDSAGRYIEIKSPPLPDGFVKGTVGAGDAFCAGVLYSAYHDKDLEDAIRLGVAVATCSISKPGNTEGVTTAARILKCYNQL